MHPGSARSRQAGDIRVRLARSAAPARPRTRCAPRGASDGLFQCHREVGSGVVDSLRRDFARLDELGHLREPLAHTVGVQVRDAVRVEEREEPLAAVRGEVDERAGREVGALLLHEARPEVPELPAADDDLSPVDGLEQLAPPCRGRLPARKALARRESPVGLRTGTEDRLASDRRRSHRPPPVRPARVAGWRCEAPAAPRRMRARQPRSRTSRDRCLPASRQRTTKRSRSGSWWTLMASWRGTSMFPSCHRPLPEKVAPREAERL
jgi:hypothetical protein